jgi:hypothetical protein
MVRPFDLLDEIADVVVLQSGSQSEVPRFNSKFASGSGFSFGHQSPPESLVDDLLEWQSTFLNFRLELSRNVYPEDILMSTGM